MSTHLLISEGGVDEDKSDYPLRDHYDTPGIACSRRFDDTVPRTISLDRGIAGTGPVHLFLKALYLMPYGDRGIHCSILRPPAREGTYSLVLTPGDNPGTTEVPIYLASRRHSSCGSVNILGYGMEYAEKQAVAYPPALAGQVSYYFQ